VPIGIITSLIVCTILYIAVSAVLTGMVPTQDIDKNAGVVKAFEYVHCLDAILVAAGAMTGITSVLLVMMLSQPRVMLALARDGWYQGVLRCHSSQVPDTLEVNDSYGPLRRVDGGLSAADSFGRND